MTSSFPVWPWREGPSRLLRACDGSAVPHPERPGCCLVLSVAGHSCEFKATSACVLYQPRHHMLPVTIPGGSQGSSRTSQQQLWLFLSPG